MRCESIIYCGVAIAVPCPGYVDHLERDTWVRKVGFLLEFVLGKRVFSCRVNTCTSCRSARAWAKPCA